MSGMGKLSGKVALVTGAGRGLGRGIALELARDGASIVVAELDPETGRRTASEIEAIGCRALAVVTDVCRREQVNATVAAAEKAFGTIDILVNNAQIQRQQVNFEDTTDDDMQVVLGSGLMGTFYFMQACFPLLRRRGGKVINVASAAGLVGYAGWASYAVAKEGIRALTKVAAHEWGKHKININAICPLSLTPEHEGVEHEQSRAREDHGRVDSARPFRGSGEGHRPRRRVPGGSGFGLHHGDDDDGRRRADDPALTHRREHDGETTWPTSHRCVEIRRPNSRNTSAGSTRTPATSRTRSSRWRVSRSSSVATSTSPSALGQLSRVDRGLKVLMSHLASSANGCRFCEAHTSHTAHKVGVEAERVAAVWEFETSALFDDAERVALRLALAMGQSPNGVGPEHFAALREHYDDEQIIEMVAAVCMDADRCHELAAGTRRRAAVAASSGARDSP